jgi:hypothetical protein
MPGLRQSLSLGGVQLLILDDWGLQPLDATARHDLLEILEERYGRRSTIITSQIPVDKWHELIGDPTYADAILDRIVHNGHRINLTGHNLRRSRANKVSKAKIIRQRGTRPRATSCRNPGRHNPGIPGRLRRNSHPLLFGASSQSIPTALELLCPPIWRAPIHALSRL